MGMQQALTGKHDTRECEVISWVFLVGAREEEVLVARSCEWFSVLIDRLDHGTLLYFMYPFP